MQKKDPYKYEMARATQTAPAVVSGYLAENRYRLLDTGMIQHSLALKPTAAHLRGHRYGWQSTNRMMDLEAFVADARARGLRLTVRRKPKKIKA